MKTSAYTPERRPLAARGWSVSHTAAAWLAARNISPNAISISGFVFSLCGGLLFASSRMSASPGACLVLGCLLILGRGMCNMLDGMVAVSTGKASRGGELFNEVPDRLSDSAILIGAGYAVGGMPVLGYLAALAAVFTAYVRVQGCALGVPADFGGPMAKTQRMVVIVLAALVTAVTPSLPASRFVNAPPMGLLTVALAMVIAGSLVTAGRRLKKCSRLLGKEAA